MLLYRDLSDPERLLVAALRRCGGGAATRALARDAAAVLGEYEAASSLPLLVELGQVLHGAGRRRPPADRGGGVALSADEIQLLQIVAAAQAGDEDRLAAHLLWSVGPAERLRLAAAARTIAARWARRGHVVRARRPALVSAPDAGRRAAPPGG